MEEIISKPASLLAPTPILPFAFAPHALKLKTTSSYNIEPRIVFSFTACMMHRLILNYLSHYRVGHRSYTHLIIHSHSIHNAFPTILNVTFESKSFDTIG